MPLNFDPEQIPRIKSFSASICAEKHSIPDVKFPGKNLDYNKIVIIFVE